MYFYPTKNVRWIACLCLLSILLSCNKDSDIFYEAVLDEPEIVPDEVGDDSSDNESDNDTTDGELSTITLSPIDDAFVQGSEGFNQNIVRVEADERIAYLKFDLSSIEGTPTGAFLEFTTDSDPGEGRLEVLKGIGNNWTEENLSIDNAPEKGARLGEINTTYRVGFPERITLNPEQLEATLTSIVLEKKSGNDLAISSKENSEFPGPKLVLEFNGEISGDGFEDEEEPITGSSDNVIVLNDLKAFPSAIGAGAYARVNPNEARIYEVTNLNDSGSGSFRDAFEANGPRIIIIKVEGLVSTNNPYQAQGSAKGDFAVWGQFAPGLGLTIDHPRMTTDRMGNMIWRFMTLQAKNGLGCAVNTNCFDALNFYRVKPNTSVYVDHLSLRYSPDQTWTLNVDDTEGNLDLIRSTVANTLFAEADPAHSTGSIMNVWNSSNGGLAIDIGDHTFARNMFYDISHRFQNLNTNGDFENYNNYVVNFKARASRYNITPNVDFHRNYYLAGNATNARSGLSTRVNQLNHGVQWGSNEPQIYAAFNFFDGVNTNVSDNLQDDLYVWYDTENASYYGKAVVENDPVPTEFFTTAQQFGFNPPADGYWDTMDIPAKMHNNVGHNRGINANGTPFYGYDDVDADYINKVRNNNTNRTYRDPSSWNNSTFPGTALYADSDNDNMPDWFEDQFPFLDKNDPSDMLATSNVTWNFNAIGIAHDYTVINDAGYTNLEMCAAFYAGDFETMLDGTNNLKLDGNLSM